MQQKYPIKLEVVNTEDLCLGMIFKHLKFFQNFFYNKFSQNCGERIAIRPNLHIVGQISRLSYHQFIVVLLSKKFPSAKEQKNKNYSQT
jgi:hypothetical protein